LLQSYFNITGSGKPNSSLNKPEEQTARYSVAQLKQMRDTIRNLGQSSENAQTDYYKKNLFYYGMSEYQLEEMERTRKIPEVMEIRAPIPGFILSRNVSPDLRFDRGVEFFRIADLSRVWILADVFENEASFFKPGMRVKMELPYQKKILSAKMSNVLPQFDSSSRTLKVRLEADNPGYIMRPDMFVNVEIPVSGPAAIIVPADAVVDSGLKKTVFVDRGNGYFEPRQVETGGSLGERVEITRGLMLGEKIVVAGNFLIDSETRMQQSAAGSGDKAGRDLVCGMNIDENRSKAVGYLKDYKGKTYFFCSPECRDEFVKTPDRYSLAVTASPAMATAVKKGGNVVDHSAHRAMKGASPQGTTSDAHDHGRMKSTMPKGGTVLPSPGLPPGEGDKARVMPGPKASGSAQIMSGSNAGQVMPGSQAPISMPTQMPGAVLPSPAGNSAPMMPSTGAGTVSSSVSPPVMTGPGIGMAMPSPSNNLIISPGPNPTKAEQQMKAPGGGQDDD
jgi:RND family efflux transporter MFP subunit